MFLLFYLLTFYTMTTLNSYALLDSSDNAYAQIRILQTTSQPAIDGKAQPGKIYNTLTEESHDSLDVVVLGVRKEFRVWPDGNGLSKYPEYISRDMKTLSHLDPETGKKIGEEPLAKSEKWTKRKLNPKARTQYYFIAAVPGDTMPVFFRVDGLATVPAKQFLNKARHTGKQIYEFVTSLSVGELNTRFGKRFIPRFNITSQDLPKDWTPEKSGVVCQKFIEETQKSLPSG